MDKNVINIRGLEFKYNNEYLFNNFDLSIEKGKITTIMGPNGSGKTTLIKILSGLLDYKGYININGYHLDNFYLEQIRRSMGIILDDVENNFIGETVEEDLVYTLENLNYSYEDITNKLNNIVRLFKISDILNKKPDELNLSEKQKVLIASVLIYNPSIIILDEALHNLNTSDKKLVIEILNNYKKENNATIVLITHNIEDILISDKIIILNNGNIYLEGNIEDIIKEEDKIFSLGLELPFIIKLSNNLILYSLIDKVYYDMDELVNALWK